MNKKLIKLVRDPKLFFKDMYQKRARWLSTVTPKKHNGNYQYTVVSAVYNVGNYLDEYFKSFIKQRLDFAKHIHLILVDDGSTDTSASIINKWQKRYPKNITYLYKENGGQASARNLGLQHVKTEWVTFIDPDDFVDVNYFREIDNFLRKYKGRGIKLLCNKMVVYKEEQKVFSDTQPLSYCFTKGDAVFAYNDLGKNIQLSASSAVFLSDQICNKGILFDHRVRPNFEDGKFIAAYLESLTSGVVGFSDKAKYYYRVRADNSSTTNTQWEVVGKYSNVLEYGFLEALKQYSENKGNVPVHIQRTVLYFLVQYFKRIVNKPEAVGFLTEDQKQNFLELLDAIFNYIDDKTILGFELQSCWFFHKIGMLGCFKKQSPNFQIVYLEDYDAIKNQVLVRYFTQEVGLEEFSLDDKDTIPLFAKTVRHDFLTRTFVNERRIWLPVSPEKKLRVRVSGLEASITLAGKQHKNAIEVELIAEHFAGRRPKLQIDPIFRGTWLLMDQDIKADDNAEHLYRYIRSHYPEQKIHFVLRNDSHDWSRLADEGFNLLAFGSRGHEVALRSCSKIISSHADRYVDQYFNDKSLTGKQFIFLQHGVIKDDLSNWLNTKEKIDCFITTTNREYLSIAGDGNRYKFTKKEVVLTGCPRHDTLLSRDKGHSKVILIMPTWRRSLTGKTTTSSSRRELNPNFMESLFAQSWRSVLHSKELHTLAMNHGYRVVFFSHVNIQPYIDQFDIPSYIEAPNHSGTSIQDLFTETALLITDYSSVALELGLIQRSVIYYQFDEDEVFSGSHSYSKGYFDYRRDGFGPVVTDEASLMEELQRSVERGLLPDSAYLLRMQQFFPFRDGKNCERTYRAILALDEADVDNVIDAEILYNYAEAADVAKDWKLAESRWRAMLANGAEQYQEVAQVFLARALRHQGKIAEAQSVLCVEHNDVSPLDFGSDWHAEAAELQMANYDWEKANSLWVVENSTHPYKLRRRLRCLAELGRQDEVNRLSAELLAHDSSERNQQEVIALQALAQRDWGNMVNALVSPDGTLEEHPEWQLLRARSYRELGAFDEANLELVRYEKHTRNDPACRIEIARLSFAREQWNKTICQLAQAYPEGVTAAPFLDVHMQLQAQRLSGKFAEAAATAAMLDHLFSETPEFILEKAELASRQGDWASAIEIWEKMLSYSSTVPYRLAEAYREIGEVEKALALLFEAGVRPPQSANEWILRAELATLNDNWQEAAWCWKSILRFHNADAPAYAWDRLQAAQLLARNAA